MIDLGPPPLVFPKPAIIRPATTDVLSPALQPGMPHLLMGRRLSIEHTDNDVSLSNQTTYNFSGLSLGATATSRRTIITVGNITDTDGAIDGAPTIGGVGMTIVGRAVTVSPGVIQIDAYIFIADTSSLGATATFSITFQQQQGGVGLSVYRVLGLGSSTFFDRTIDEDDSNPLQLSLDSVSGGIIVAATMCRNGSTTTYSGGLVKDSDVDIETGDRFSSAHGRGSGTPFALTATNGVSPDNYCGLSASWK